MFIRNPINEDLFIASNRPNRSHILFFVRYYPYIVGALVTAILIISLIKGYQYYLFVILPIYWVYVFARAFYQKQENWSKYYKSKNLQFARALVLVVAATVLLFFLYNKSSYYRTLKGGDNLWLLYLLAVYVVSQRGSTKLFGLILTIVIIALYIVEPKNDLALISVLGIDFTVNFVSRSASLLLLSVIFYIFIRHMADTIADLNLILKVQDKLRNMESGIVNIGFNRSAYLEQVVEMISSDFKYDHVNIFRTVNHNSQAVCVAAACLKGKDLVSQGYFLDLDSQKSIISQVVNTGKRYVSNDVHNDPYYFRHDAFPNTKAELTVPINTASGLYGVLDVQVHSTEYFLDQDLSAIEILANHVGWIIDNTRQIKQIDSVNKIIKNIAGPIFTQNDLEDTLHEVANTAFNELKADIVVLYAYDSRDEKLTGPIYAGHAFYPDLLLMSEADPENIIYRILSRDDDLYLFADLNSVDMENHFLFRPLNSNKLSGKPSFLEREEIRANVIIPLTDDKEYVGVLILNYRTPQVYSEWDKQRYFTFAHLAALGIQKMQFHQHMLKVEMADLADRVHDTLVGDALGLLKTLDSIQVPYESDDRGKLEEKLTVAKKMTDRLYNDIRYVSNVLKLDSSDDLRLDLDRLAVLFKQIYRIDIIQKWDENFENIPLNLLQPIRYILREIITNSIRHGKAQVVNIDATINDTSFILKVFDDGKGFNPKDIKRLGGLRSIGERLKKIGGELTINSHPENGTQIELILPLIL
jgi:signal transduction histidine kinase